MVTVIYAISDSESYLPPMFIFPRKTLRDSLMKNAAPGAVGHVSEFGWTNDDLFIKWLEQCEKCEVLQRIKVSYYSGWSSQPLDIDYN